MDFGLIAIALLVGSVIAYQFDGGAAKQKKPVGPTLAPEQKLAEALEEYLKLLAASQAKEASQGRK
jgi:hypothetical protein